MIVIPEMFNKTPITIDKIISLMVSSIVQRRIVGMDYGAAVISEGVFHELYTNKAEQALDAISYFRLADYWYHLEADHHTHQFLPNSHFEEVLALSLIHI